MRGMSEAAFEQKTPEYVTGSKVPDYYAESRTPEFVTEAKAPVFVTEQRIPEYEPPPSVTGGYQEARTRGEEQAQAQAQVVTTAPAAAQASPPPAARWGAGKILLVIGGSLALGAGVMWLLRGGGK